MNILDVAITHEGGVGKLAIALGVSQTVVSNWKARGLSKAWTQALSQKYKTQARKAAAKEED